MTFIVALFAWALMLECTPVEAVAAKAVSAGLQTVCTALDAQPEPEWVYYTCVGVDATGTVVETFATAVPKSQNASFASHFVHHAEAGAP